MIYNSSILSIYRYLNIIAGRLKTHGVDIMEFNLIFAEGHSYHLGYNPYDEVEKLLVEKNGVYYSFKKSCNHDYQIFNVSVVKLPEEIPAEYDTRDHAYHRWCQHGGIVNLNLLLYKILDDDEFLSASKAKERQLYREKSLAKQIAENSICSLEYLNSLGLSEEEMISAKAWREKVMSEALNGIPLHKYKFIFEEMVDICKEKAIVVCHKEAYYSHPGDYIIRNNDIIDPESYNGTLPLRVSDQYRPTSFRVLNISKELEVAKDKFYLGSYYTQGYPVDVYKSLEDGIYCHSNIYTSWNNSQVWGKSLDRGLKVPRFCIETGSEDIFEEDNAAMMEEKRIKRDYFLNTMKAAQNTFEISWADAKFLLDELGSVTGLATPS